MEDIEYFELEDNMYLSNIHSVYYKHISLSLNYITNIKSALLPILLLIDHWWEKVRKTYYYNPGI